MQKQIVAAGRSLALAGVLGWSLWAQGAQASAQEIAVDQEDAVTLEGDVESQEGIEVLTSGPVHEAFASVIQVDPRPGIVVDVEPPGPIEEVPPEFRPEEDVVWIPGYWAWDEAVDDFVWVSGVWRQPPPGYEWVPGYWEPFDDGFQWISGYWASIEVEETAYLPTPPETLEIGPSSPPPGSDYFWVPGMWVWRLDHYVWRPGYWAVVHPGWVWIPAHYVWSPTGCIYVDGYWDYPVRHRGMLFAPVHFVSPVYTRPAFRLVPRVVFNAASLIAHLFVRPDYCHYYYGDYYAPAYYRQGIFPWYLYQSRGFGYDPLYWYYGSSYRGGYGAWSSLIHDRYQYYRAREAFRPPRTLRDQIRLAERGDVDRSLLVARRLNEVVNESPDRFTELDQQSRERLQERNREFRQFARDRARLETEARAGRGERADASRPVRLRRPESPMRQAAAEQQARRDERRREGGRAAAEVPPEAPAPAGGQRADRDRRDEARRPGRELPPGQREADADRRGRPDRARTPERADRPGRRLDAELPREDRPDLRGREPDSRGREGRPDLRERPEPRPPSLERGGEDLRRSRPGGVDRPDMRGRRPELDRRTPQGSRDPRAGRSMRAPEPQPTRDPRLERRPSVERPPAARAPVPQRSRDPRVERRPSIERPPAARAPVPQRSREPRVERRPSIERPPAARAPEPQRRPQVERPSPPSRPPEAERRDRQREENSRRGRGRDR